MDNLIQKNFHNLITLWEEMSKPHGAYFSQTAYSYCFSTSTPWLNRLWLKEPASLSLLTEIKELIQNTGQPMMVSCPVQFDSKPSPLFEELGFTTLFDHPGMSLKLETPLESTQALELRQVSNSTEAQLWSQLFQTCYNFLIPPHYLEACYGPKKEKHTPLFFIVYNTDNAAIGTIALNYTQDIVGFHALGIIPEMRRRGYAEQVMKHIINIGVGQRKPYATFQSSAMGKQIYLRLGAIEDFSIRNYTMG
ncbi:hypothetical protein BKI52_34165 [marine bacterium AO1-C]|nr:hypothetical protein BKI52_34165 [marine bacterium AO1-C]